MKTYITTARMGITSIGLAAALAGTTAMADQVFQDDVIVVGSLCVGVDCVNGESFGFDTIRLKENNLRIKAQDTSSSASFPSNDWQITFNDSANGGANKFSIDDITGGRTPFTIEASAPSNSLYVDDGGRIGVGTATPVVEMHVVNGDSPTLRLEQNGASGFSPQTWDIAGNETNFFVRDATNGSKLPFKIRPSAPTNSLYVDTDGDIGFGTASPDARLHVINGSTNALLVDNTDGGAGDAFAHFRTSGGTAPVPAVLIEDTNAVSAVRRMLELRNNGGTFMSLTNTNSAVRWNLTNENTATNSRFFINDNGDADNEFVLDAAGNVTLTGSITTTGGTCGGGCDRVFSADYELLTIDEHSNQMFANSYLPNVGPTLENTPINISDKLGRMLNELEHAHIYIDQMHKRIEQSDTALAFMVARLEKLENQLQSQD